MRELRDFFASLFAFFPRFFRESTEPWPGGIEAMRPETLVEPLPCFISESRPARYTPVRKVVGRLFESGET